MSSTFDIAQTMVNDLSYVSDKHYIKKKNLLWKVHSIVAKLDPPNIWLDSPIKGTGTRDLIWLKAVSLERS